MGLQSDRMTYRFGAFEFDDQSLELRKNGRLVALEPQPARALALLLSRANEIVTRDELRLAVWAGHPCRFRPRAADRLSAIRQALGDKGDNPRFVQTLPRKGYCFVAPVRAPEAVASATPQPDSETGAANISAPRVSRRLALGAAIVVLAAGVVWFATTRSGGARAVIAVSMFDNETGDPAYDRLGPTSPTRSSCT